MDTNPDASPPAGNAAPQSEVVYQLVYDETLMRELWARVRQARSGTRWMQATKIVLAVPLVGILAFVCWHQGHGVWFARIVLAVVLLALIFSAQADRWLASRHWKASPYWNRPCRLGFDAEGVQTETDLGGGNMRWAAFTAARRWPDGLLLFAGPGLAWWLPDARLTEGTVAEMVKLIRQSGIPYQER